MHPNAKISKLFIHNLGLVHESNLNMTRKLTLWLLLLICKFNFLLLLVYFLYPGSALCTR